MSASPITNDTTSMCEVVVCSISDKIKHGGFEHFAIELLLASWMPPRSLGVGAYWGPLGHLLDASSGCLLGASFHARLSSYQSAPGPKHSMVVLSLYIL